MEKSIPVLFTRNEECCACTACYVICPKNAIAMKTDKKGFEYPKIDESKCIRCLRCIDVCPIKSRKNAEKNS